MIREAIIKLSRKENLTYAETEAVMDEIMSGSAEPVNMAAFLTALRMKGETVEELTEEKIKQINVSISYLIKDIDRTYYTKRFTEGDGINELNRVLEGVSIIKNNVRYCQGMNFIGGSLIQLLNSESKAFMIFNCLLKEYELSNLFAYVRNINYF